MNSDNLIDIITKLLTHLTPQNIDSQYKTDLVVLILRICSKDTYVYMTDFEWYIEEVLVEIVYVEDINVKIYSFKLMLRYRLESWYLSNSLI